MTTKKPTKRAPPPTVPKELTLRRTIRAPRDRIYRAWATGESMARWWGPDGFTTSRCEVELRTGGALRIDMRAPDGTIYPMTGTFRAVHPNERIEFVTTPLDGAGEALFEVLNVVTFSESRDGTVVELRAKVVSTTPAAAPYLQGMEAGWTQQLGRLDGFARGGA